MTFQLMLCCNDERGQFAGQVEALEVFSATGDLLRLESQYADWAPKMTRGKDWIRIGGICVPISGYKTWVGNWCWDSVDVDGLILLSLLNQIRRRGWFSVDVGEMSLFQKWNRDEDFTESDLEVMAE